jgi:hypothetical protein
VCARNGLPFYGCIEPRYPDIAGTTIERRVRKAEALILVVAGSLPLHPALHGAGFRGREGNTRGGRSGGTDVMLLESCIVRDDVLTGLGERDVSIRCE